jgi:hypothetical protein
VGPVTSHRATTRRSLALLVALPLALIGVEFGHMIANAVFGAPKGEIFASPTSGEGLLVPALALAAASIVVGLAARIAGHSSGERDTRVLGTVFAVLPPIAFTCLEATEGILHGGLVPWHEFARPTFLLGLVLQAPFAVAAYVLSRAVLRLGDAVRVALRAAVPPVCWPIETARPEPADDRLRPRVARGIARGRAPPARPATG